jgi:NADH:ubiquinone oxidoreductase subunit C
MIEDLRTVDKGEVKKALAEMKAKDYRLITVIAAIKNDKLEITYPLESWKGRKFAAVRTVYELTDEVKSVQDIFLNAMLYELEIVDLFDVKVENCAPGIYLDAEKRGPFRRDV